MTPLARPGYPSVYLLAVLGRNARIEQSEDGSLVIMLKEDMDWSRDVGGGSRLRWPRQSRGKGRLIWIIY